MGLASPAHASSVSVAQEGARRVRDCTALDAAAAPECWRVSCAATGVAADTYGGLHVKP